LKFTAETDFPSIPEPHGGVNELSDSDEKYEMPESDETELGSTDTWNDQFERIDRVRERASELESQEPSQRSGIHDLPTVHPSRDELTGIESCR
jgi:hypothetical protein